MPELHPSGRVAGKTAIVSGAGSGIGQATAKTLAAEGAAVCCTDRELDAAAATAAAIREAGGASWSRALDVRLETDWHNAFADAVERGGFDIAVHSAGISRGAPIVETTADQWREVMTVNLDGVFLGTKHAIAAMRAHGRPSSIVNVASLSGVKAQPGAAAYCASKAAVIQFSKAVALECRDHADAIRVNCVSPGGVKTPMWRTMPFFRDLVAAEGGEEQAYAAMTQAEPHARFAEPDEIAATILFLASDEASYVTGANLPVDHGGSA